MISAPSLNIHGYTSPTEAKYANLSVSDEIKKERSYRVYETIWLPEEVKHSRGTGIQFQLGPMDCKGTATRSGRGLRRPLLGAIAGGCVIGLVAAAGNEALDPAALSAGVFTTPEPGAAAFSIPIAMLDAELGEAFAKGKEQFNDVWVVAPEPSGVWGLGPTFNEDRCAHCHVNNGRAAAPADGQPAAQGMLVRLSVPGETREGGPLPHPAYGDQLQNRGIRDRVPAEGQAVFTYTAREVSFADGEESRCACRIEPGPGVRELGKDTMISPRAAPAMVGMGLLEAVPEETILRIAKEQEQLAMAGKPNYVWDAENEQVALGRFGWKANQPSIRLQTAAAFLGDIGATTFLFPEENCPAVQVACLDVPSASKCGGQGGCTGNTYRPEVVPSRLTNITLYLQALAVRAPQCERPARSR